MKNRVLMLFAFLAVAVLVVAGIVSLRPAQGQGMGAPEALAKQQAFEKTIPQLQITEQILPLTIPGHTLGETEGVAKDSKGNLYVYSRTGWAGSARGGNGAKLFKFDAQGKYVTELMPDSYGESFAHQVRVDKYDNIWAVDEGAGMIMKLNPAGTIITMNLGRKTEAIDYLERFLERGEKIPEANRHPVGNPYTYSRPTDVAWDAQDNIYISDGYGNSRFTKQDKNGMWKGAVGTYGSGPQQFNTVHAIDADANNVYVSDRGNWRIQVYDTNMNWKANWVNIGMPWATCIPPGGKFLFSGDGTGKIYKMDMTGKVLGWAQTRANRGQSGCLIHAMHCESATVIYDGSCSQWTVDKITIK